ncbi:hypothetical protein N7509_006464 [Penicillium cosmopolitanum]|uniref:Uncharacterized protein n=1 Tax=Penicillium cosmopolitanum TaxID=1131564 RepID=A0A9W9W4K6_9EURO|nr:uncharacterized protein N7509_006464 [Penicillium cosmopolitanum]KAJ5398351.1 hypothetical protein N7509_006464 [Penicillium cosmopolitanum]
MLSSNQRAIKPTDDEEIKAVRELNIEYLEEVKVEIDSISNYKEEDIVDPKEREKIPSLDSYNYKELQPT